MPSVAFTSNKVSQLTSHNNGASIKVKNTNEAREMISEWFEQKNRPVTVQSLTDALGSRVAKSLVQKILEEMAKGEFLQIKDLKKVRFYYYHSSKECIDTVDASNNSEEQICKDSIQIAINKSCQQEITESTCSEQLEVETDVHNVLNGNKTECFGISGQCDDCNLENSNTNDVTSLLDQIMCIRELIASRQTEKKRLARMQTNAERKKNVQEVQRNVEKILQEVWNLKQHAEHSRTNQVEQELLTKNRELEELLEINSKVRLIWQDRKYLAITLLGVITTEFTDSADVVEKLSLHPGAESNAT